MSIYTKVIMEATKCKPEDAPRIERAMREVYRTLDGLDRRRFVREARIAHRIVQLYPNDYKS